MAKCNESGCPHLADIGANSSTHTCVDTPTNTQSHIGLFQSSCLASTSSSNFTRTNPESDCYTPARYIPANVQAYRSTIAFPDSREYLTNQDANSNSYPVANALTYDASTDCSAVDSEGSQAL